MMRSSYATNDVSILLKDITGQIEPESTEVRERNIQLGVHYCEMLPMEHTPDTTYLSVFQEMMYLYSKPVAKAVSVMAEVIYKKDKNPVLVSLARAGIPAGILVKHYLQRKYHIEVPHYAISIIRGRGIDMNAMDFIISKHGNHHLIFIDGWTGKGAIKRQLDEAIHEYYPNINPCLAVIADPAGVADIYGTSQDLMIPSSCLNSIVTGLISRTVLRSDLIGPNDFHGAVYYGDMEDEDLSIDFIERIEAYFDFDSIGEMESRPVSYGYNEAYRLMHYFHIHDVNLVKPGIGEATRVLLRRIPDMIVINEDDKDTEELQPIYCLCEEKDVPIVYMKLKNYKVCGLIKDLADA